MGANCRSDSEHFLIYLPGHHSNPMRITQVWGLLGVTWILQHQFALHLDGAEEVWVLILTEHFEFSVTLTMSFINYSPLVITFRPETSHKTNHHIYKAVPNRICQCHIYCTLTDAPSASLFHSLTLAPSFVIVLGISWLHKEASPDCREMLLCISWRWSACHSPYMRHTLQTLFADHEPLAKAVLIVCSYKTSRTEALPQLGPQKHGYKTSYK